MLAWPDHRVERRAPVRLCLWGQSECHAGGPAATSAGRTEKSARRVAQQKCIGVAAIGAASERMQCRLLAGSIHFVQHAKAVCAEVGSGSIDVALCIQDYPSIGDTAVGLAPKRVQNSLVSFGIYLVHNTAPAQTA